MRTTYSTPAVTAGIVAAFAGLFMVFAVWRGDWYATWLALHILAAIVWIGGALMIQFFAFRLLKENDPQRMARFAKDVEVIGMRTFIPASLVLLVLGFVMVHQAGWDWRFWLVFAIVVWALSFVSGAAFLGPESGRIAKVIEERGGADAEVQARIERILFVSRIEVALIALVAMDMVLKPGL
jgi:uncharacterized membrane protein